MGASLSAEIYLDTDESINQPLSSSKSASRGSDISEKRSRRQLEKELARAARERRADATEKYFNNSPKEENIWICEFCEYERIFGRPPRALIRAYETKDRLARQQEAERKRLLEKAKAKARKTKRNSKAPAKAASSSSNHIDTPPNDQDAPLPAHLGDGEHEEVVGHAEGIPSPLTNTRRDGHDGGGGSQSLSKSHPGLRT
jgi:hypothetical protein